MPADEDDVVAAPVAPKAPAAPKGAAPKGAGAGAVGVKRTPDVKPSGQTPEEARAALADYDAGVEKMQLQPYLDRLARVDELRRKGQIGERKPVLQPSGGWAALGMLSGWLPGAQPSTSSPSMQGTTIEPGTRPSYGAAPSGYAAKTVRPTQMPAFPEGLGTRAPIDIAKEAKAYGDQLKQAVAAYDAGESNIARLAKDPTVARSELPAKAAEQKRRLEAVLNLAAQMREYGWEGTNPEIMEQFRQK